MNFRSFIQKTLFALGAVAVMAFATSASAQDVQSTCTGCTSSPPAVDTPSLNFVVGGGAVSSGFGAAVFEGVEGYAIAEKNGYSGVDIVLSAGGEFCGADCSIGSFTFNGYAGEHVTSGAGALSNVSGSQAAVANQTGAFSQVNFGFSKFLAPSQP